MELWVGSGREGSGEVFQSREEGRCLSGPAVHTRRRSDPVARTGEKDFRVAAGLAGFGRQVAAGPGKIRCAGRDSDINSNGGRAAAHLSVPGDRNREKRPRVGCAEVSDLRQSRRLEMMNGSKAYGPSGEDRASGPMRAGRVLRAFPSPSPRPSPWGSGGTVPSA